MQFDLERDDLMILIADVHPPFDNIGDYAVLGCIFLYGNQVMGWEWNELRLEEKSDEDLWQIYQDCKKQIIFASGKLMDSLSEKPGRSPEGAV